MRCGSNKDREYTLYCTFLHAVDCVVNSASKRVDGGCTSRGRLIRRSASEGARNSLYEAPHQLTHAVNSLLPVFKHTSQEKNFWN